MVTRFPLLLRFRLWHSEQCQCHCSYLNLTEALANDKTVGFQNATPQSCTVIWEVDRGKMALQRISCEERSRSCRCGSIMEPTIWSRFFMKTAVKLHISFVVYSVLFCLWCTGSYCLWLLVRACHGTLAQFCLIFNCFRPIKYKRNKWK